MDKSEFLTILAVLMVGVITGIGVYITFLINYMNQQLGMIIPSVVFLLWIFVYSF